MKLRSSARSVSLCLLFTAIASPATQADTTPPLQMQEMTDKFGVIQAIEAGDDASLSKLAESTSDATIKAYAEAGLYRVRFDLEKSSQAATRCVELSRKADNLVQALACAMIRTGNFLLAENPSAWAAGIRDIRQGYYPGLRQRFGATFALRQLEQGFDMAPIASHPGTSAPASYGADKGELALHKIAKGKLNPATGASLAAIDLRSGRTVFDAIPDTAGFMTLFNRPTARDLGLDAHDEWISPSRERTIASSLGYVHELAIGTRTLNDVPAAVVDAETPNLLGLTTLRRLGRVVLTQRAMAFGNTGGTSCKQGLAARSDLIGTNAKLMISLTVDGKPIHAVFDSGFDGELEQFGSATAGDLEGEKKQIRIFTAKGQMDTSFVEKRKRVDLGLGARDAVVRVRPGNGDVRYIAGMGLLSGAAVEIDFVRNTFCVASVGH